MTAFVLSLLGILCCGILCPIGFFMARSARQDVAAHPGEYMPDDGLLTAAWILGLIGTILLVVAIVIGIIAAATGSFVFEFSVG